MGSLHNLDGTQQFHVAALPGAKVQRDDSKMSIDSVRRLFRPAKQQEVQLNSQESVRPLNACGRVTGTNTEVFGNF